LKILISVKDTLEAKAVRDAGGVDFIDIKNPDEGTLGANHPWIIRDITRVSDEKTEIAASVGDLDFKPGSASLAAHAVASIGVDYVTASISSLTPPQAKEMVTVLLKTLEPFETGLIVAGYADCKRIGSTDPTELLENSGGADYFMLDTRVKDGKNILDFMSLEDLESFKERAHSLEIGVIVAGSIRYPQISVIKKVMPDILGFRGIVSEKGEVKTELVSKLLKELNN